MSVIICALEENSFSSRGRASDGGESDGDGDAADEAMSFRTSVLANKTVFSWALILA